jgi:DNA-directed RNA polymerase alpha subunit
MQSKKIDDPQQLREIINKQEQELFNLHRVFKKKDDEILELKSFNVALQSEVAERELRCE